MNHRTLLVTFVLLIAAIALMACSAPPLPAPLPSPLPPTFAPPPPPTATPKPVPAPTSQPLVSCQPLELSKTDTSLDKFKNIAELGDDRAVEIGMSRRVFSVPLAGGSPMAVLVQNDPSGPIVITIQGNAVKYLPFTESQVYLVKLTCVQDLQKLRTEEVQFYFTDKETYLYFPSGGQQP